MAPLLRIGYLVGHWPEPSETFLAREVEALPRHGVEPIVLALDELPLLTPPLTPGLRRILLDAARAGPRQAARRLRRLPAAAGLVTRLAELHCVGLHAAWASLPAHVAWMARQLGGPPYTVAGHARDVFGPPEAAPQAMSESRGLTTCNRAAWRALAGRWGAEHVAYCPHGLPLDLWPHRRSADALVRKPRETRPIRAGEGARAPMVLGVGRLVPKKGFDTLVRACAAGGWPLRILGEGPERATLAALAAHLGVTLEMPGHVDEETVRAALHEASVLALPSRVVPGGDRDGLANVLLEALAVGVPVVTTPAGAAEDVIVHGRSGLLVAPDAPHALAAALRRVLDEPGLAARLADAGRAAVEHGYDLEVNTERLARWLLSCHATARGERAWPMR
jgi:glycosyltransferase involved in cell wall biosynthesis